MTQTINQTVAKKPSNAEGDLWQAAHVDRRFNSWLMYISSIIQLAVIAIMAYLMATNQSFGYSAAIRLIILVLSIIGLFYNLIIWPRLKLRDNPIVVFSVAITVSITLMVLTFADGGLSSQYFVRWFTIVIIAGLLSRRTCYLAAGITLTYYLVATVLTLTTQVNHLGSVTVWILTFTASTLSFVISLLIDSYRKNVGLAERLVSQLDTAEVKEQLMMSAIADAVVGVDQDLKIVLFNQAAENLTGWDLKSALGIQYNSVFKLKDAKDQDLTSQTDPFALSIRENKHISRDNFYMLDKNNQKISLSISIAPTYDIRQQINGAVAVFHDISEQKAVQRERNEFVSTASHEMRTPVAAIEGYLSMAINPNLATVDERAKNFIDKAHNSALHLGKLFQDLLSVTKIEDKRLIDNRQVFNLSELITQIASEMEIIAKRKNLVLHTHIGGDDVKSQVVLAPTFQISADPDRLREVVTNLIDNAIKYTRTGNIDIYLSGNRQSVTVSIADTGGGISAEDQKHLFQKFYRVNNSMTREIGGTGLGLYIARSLIEMYGGRIWVESEVGKGSKFNFSLPLVK